MKTCAKVNLGLNVVNRREDGYHNIQTVFLPIPLYDELHVEERVDLYDYPCQLIISGNKIDCDDQNNLVVKAYNLLAQDYSLPYVRVILYKKIPSQAGMGGGSSDAACMIKLLNKKYELGISVEQMERYASLLGADCAVFIQSKPTYAEGIGDKLYPIPGIQNQLGNLRLAVVKPAVNISTHEAFAHVIPHYPKINCLEVVMQPVDTWRGSLTNDFEEYAFDRYIELREITNTLYRMGAVYASLTGSGSAIYALLPKNQQLTRRQLRRIFPECYTTVMNIRDDKK